jgi:flagella basal body P-ring formation protein FlgA
MQNTGQLLSHPFIRRWTHWCQRSVWLWLALLGAPTAQAQTPSPVAADNGLSTQVRQWISARHQVGADTVQLLPLDPRLQSRPCQSVWLLDQPFPQQTDTVRARCTQPVWQVFVRAAWPGSHTAAAAQANPAPAPAPKPVAAAPETRTVVVSNGLLQRGTRIQPDQVELAERDAHSVGGVVVERLEDVLHAEVVRDIPAGSVLRGSDIRPAWLIRKGQLVQLSWSPSPGFQISARVEALDNGRMGEPVRLKNRDSGRIISGVVTGLGTVSGL